MSLNQNTRILIAAAAKKVIDSRLESFPSQETVIRNAPFHSAFMHPFEKRISNANTNFSNESLIALASWLHGLSTSLGQSFFEPVAHALSNGSKRVVKLPKITGSQMTMIENIASGLKNGTRSAKVHVEDSLIFNQLEGDSLVEVADYTADVFFERNDEIIAIELKSVRVNSGEAGGEKRKILRAKAHLKSIYPEKEIKFFIGIPFDPTGIDPFDYDKDRYLSYLVEFNKYFDKDEILIGPELWDYLSGEEQTMQEILSIIQEVTSSYTT